MKKTGGDGADERSRTSDLLITNQLLYQLSYIGLLGEIKQSEDYRGWPTGRQYAAVLLAILYGTDSVDHIYPD